MKPLPWTWPVVLLFSSLMAGIIAFALPGTFVCMIVILWFLLVCPGMTVVRYLNLKDLPAEWTLAIALSLAIDALVASITLYAGAWFPPGILGMLITFCIVGIMGQFFLARPVPLPQAGPSRRKVDSLAMVFLLIVLVALISGLGIWSYNKRVHAATTVSATPHQAPQPLHPTAISSGAPVIDTISVRDDGDHIAMDDPQGDCLKAAQPLARMLPTGSDERDDL